MAELVTYEIQSRPGGVGTPLVQLPPTAGALLVIVQHGVVCHAPADGLELMPPQAPLAESVLDITPMLSLCRITRVLDDPDAFAARTDELWSLFGKRLSRSPHHVLAGQRAFRDLTVPTFGDELDLGALDAIDLAGQPEVLERFRASYRAIFVTGEAYELPQEALFSTEPGETFGSWDQAKLDELAKAAADPANPMHRLELWWWHAVSSVAVPAIAQLTGGHP